MPAASEASSISEFDDVRDDTKLLTKGNAEARGTKKTEEGGRLPTLLTLDRSVGEEA